MMITGLFDDRFGLSALFRFIVQLAICLLLIRFTGVQLHDFGRLFTSEVFNLGWLAIPITVFGALGVINSYNLIDGMDGLSGGMFVVAASGLALFAGMAEHMSIFWFLLVGLAAVFGFLLLNARFPWNSKARIFLGDSGSLMLGLLLAWCFIKLGSGADRAFMPMTAVWLFSVPLLDTSTMIWLRWRDGRSALSADQHHLHHAFMRAGYSVGETWLAIMLLALVMAGIGIGFELSALPDWLSFYTFVGIGYSYYFYIKHSWASQRFLGRHFIHHDFEIEEGYA